jgi:hypothetical protein
MTTFPPESPFFEMRPSKTAMVDLPELRYMTIGGFSKMTGATFDEAFLISIESHDGRRIIDLDSKRARFLIQRGRRNS